MVIVKNIIKNSQEDMFLSIPSDDSLNLCAVSLLFIISCLETVSSISLPRTLFSNLKRVVHFFSLDNASSSFKFYIVYVELS